VWSNSSNKCPKRRATFVSSESISRENNSESAWLRRALCSQTGLQSSRNWHIGLGSSQNEESYCSRRNAWSDNTSSNISKCERHFNDFLCVSCSRSTSPLDNDIGEFVTCSLAPQKAGCSFRQGFHFQIWPEAFHQC
jgi:hypothetical protein